MEHLTFQTIGPALAAFVLSATLTPLMRVVARNRNMVAQPKPERWHNKPTALLGGVAISLAMTLVMVPLALESPGCLVVLGGAMFLFLIGLIDDIHQIKPYQKLVAQLMAASLVVVSGLTLPWTPWMLVNMTITFIWLVGITNAINLLDNMDGLAAGIAAIAGVFLSLHFFANGQVVEGTIMLAFVGVLVGFLLYNFNPASIFMGDCGSMFIGFLLAGVALLSAEGGRSRSVLSILAVPVLILLIPIFDTTLVTLVRKLSGRSIVQGGRDHASHRLVALGLSERRAVVTLYILSIAAGTLALAVTGLPVDMALATLGTVTLGLIILGVYLAEVSVYDEGEVANARKRPLVAFLFNLSYKRRIFEVLLDLVLIVLAYFLACAMLHGSMSQSGQWPKFLEVAPIFIAVKLPVLVAMGVYRGLWRYLHVDDLLTYAKAVFLASAAAALALLAVYPFSTFSLTVVALDGVLLLVLLVSSRMAFRVLRRMLHVPGSHPPDHHRVLIYGADDVSCLLLQQFQLQRDRHIKLIGFADDDHTKEGRVIQGLRVFGGNGSLRAILKDQHVDEVIVAHPFISPERLSQVCEVCSSENIQLNRIHIAIERV